MEIFNKYKIEHTDGTPLKGKKYFVLRLDSDDPIEAARVARAMRAYEGNPRNCDVGTVEEQSVRMAEYCREQYKKCCGGHVCSACKFHYIDGECYFAWAQLPYTKEGAK